MSVSNGTAHTIQQWLDMQCAISQSCDWLIAWLQADTKLDYLILCNEENKCNSGIQGHCNNVIPARDLGISLVGVSV